MDASLVSGGFGAVSSAITAYYGNKVAKIEANTSNAIRAGNNRVTAAQNSRNEVLTATQRWAQSVRNSRVYEAVEANQESLAVNFNRSRDARSRANFADNVKMAEEEGRQAAAAAASGVTGSVVDIVNMTSRIRNHASEVARVDAENQIVGDYNQQEFSQRQATLDNLDWGVIFDNPATLDFGTNTAKQTSLVSSAIAGGGKNLYNGLVSQFSTTKSSTSGGNNDLLGDFLTLNDNFSYK